MPDPVHAGVKAVEPAARQAPAYGRATNPELRELLAGHDAVLAPRHLRDPGIGV